MQAAIRDTEIFFDVHGAQMEPAGQVFTERPVCFVAHGGPGADHSFMRPGMDSLAEYSQIVYWDHRGHGRSARGDKATYTLDENVEDLEALRNHLGLEQIISIGTSYGGMVAMAHAARYPHSVSQLLLIVTAAHGGFNQRAREILAQRGTSEEKEAARKLWTGELDSDEGLRNYFRATWGLYSTTFEESKRKKNEEALARAILSPDALNRAFAPRGFLLDFDLRPELKQIIAPTLILAGRHDWICAPEFSKEINVLIPKSEMKIFENSSHSLRSDEPEEFFRTLKEFILA